MLNPKKKSALITGVVGQDGSYLAELLLSKGYVVHGLVRRSDATTSWRIGAIRDNPDFHLHYGDLTDLMSILSILRKTKPDEIYNLAAQSHVKASFDMPIETAEATGLGVLKLLEAVRQSCLKTKIYQASTSELFGKAVEIPQTEKTPFYPRSPYGFSKLFAFWAVKNYRESYGMFAVNGILFNHESERRGPQFVTRKITIELSRIKLGERKIPLDLGNLDAKRDWGYAPDYVEGMWRILQAKSPDDYVLATGECHSVREFAEEASKELGWKLSWRKDKSGKEEGFDEKTGQILIVSTTDNMRPAEVEHLIGNPEKARKELGWKPKVAFKELVKRMVSADFEKVKRGTLEEN